MTVLPTEKRFNGKCEICASDQYKRITKTLSNKMLPAIAFAVIFYAQDFKIFTIPLQLKQRMITVLYSKMVIFVKELLSKFLLDGSFYWTTNRKSLKSINKLRELDLNAVILFKCSAELDMNFLRVIILSLNQYLRHNFGYKNYMLFDVTKFFLILPTF